MNMKLLLQSTDLTSIQEFDRLKQIRTTIDLRIAKQEELLSKITRGKWKQNEIPTSKLYALAKYDLKILERDKEEVERQLPILREKVHGNLLSEVSRSLRFDNSPEKQTALDKRRRSTRKTASSGR